MAHCVWKVPLGSGNHVIGESLKVWVKFKVTSNYLTSYSRGLRALEIKFLHTFIFSPVLYVCDTLSEWPQRSNIHNKVDSTNGYKISQVVAFLLRKSFIGIFQVWPHSHYYTQIRPHPVATLWRLWRKDHKMTFFTTPMSLQMISNKDYQSWK